MKIQEVKRYRFEASEEEIRAMVDMFRHYAETCEEDTDIHVAVRHAFGVQAKSLDEREETLVEKALSNAQGRRKGRVAHAE